MTSHGVCAAVVVNAAKLDDGDSTRQQPAAALARGGCGTPLWVGTSADDPGHAVTEKALAQGAELILALGGDGTVRAVVTVLAGSKVPLGVVPLGTGNPLARNLGIPLGDLAAAVDVALEGADRVIDLGRVGSPGTPGRQGRFVVMAGWGWTPRSCETPRLR